MKKYTTVKIKGYIEGLKDVDLSKVALAGEDFTNNRMMVTIIDWADWVNLGARTIIGEKREDVQKVINALTKHLEDNRGEKV